MKHYVEATITLSSYWRDIKASRCRIGHSKHYVLFLGFVILEVELGKWEDEE